MQIQELITQKQWFKEWFNTSFYHKLYRNRNEGEAKAFVDNLINLLQPDKNATMLDLGCGSGRHARQLAAHGYKVTGLDLAASSISEAKSRNTPGAQFYQHDMRLPFCVSRFNYVFNFFTSFGYFNTNEENNDVMNNISMSLKPNGILVMDYLNVTYAENNTLLQEEKEIDGVIYSIKRWNDDTHFYKNIKILNKNDIAFTEKVQKLTLPDFDLMFKRYGLKLIRIAGDYFLNKYNIETSPRLIMIAEKV
jgi:SAM-dependent methyltransferase